MASASSAESRGRTRKLIYFFGALGGMLFGYDTGVISGAILFINNDFALTPFLKGLVVASILIGAALGAAVAGPLSDRLGRRNLILIAAVTFTVGAIGAALSPSAGVLIFFRFVIGLAVGAAALTVPLYLSEVAPTEIRGAISSLNQLMITVGILVAYIVDAILASSGAWRWMLGLAAIPAIVLLVGMYFMPETPRWLMSRNREDEARDVLLRSRTEEETEEEIQDIKEVEREEEEGGLKELAASWVRPALIVAIGLAAFQQFVGVNTIIYYAPTTFTKVGFTPVQAIYGEAIIGVINVVMTLVAIWLIDRLGRKPLLLIGLVGMVLSLAVLGFSHFFLPQPSDLTDPEAIITFVCTATYIISFAATWGPVVWVMLPEVLPLRIRGTAMGAAVFANWVSNFIVSQTFPMLLSAWGPGITFLAYAGMGVLAFLFVYTLVTETKGRSLEQIETDLRKKTSFSTGKGEGTVQ